MAEKKDKTKETKSGEPKKATVKAKAPAKEAKKETKTVGGDKERATREPIPTPRLKKKYHDVVVPALMKEFSYKNPMQAPKLVKVVLNVGLGEAISNAKALDFAADELGKITGQRPSPFMAEQKRRLTPAMRGGHRSAK